MADPTTLQLLLREVAMVVRPLVEIAEVPGSVTEPPIIIDDGLTGPDVPEGLDFPAVDRLIDLLRNAGVQPDPHKTTFRSALQSAASALTGLRSIIDAAIDGDPSAIKA